MSESYNHEQFAAHVIKRENERALARQAMQQGYDSGMTVGRAADAGLLPKTTGHGPADKKGKGKK